MTPGERQGIGDVSIVPSVIIRESSIGFLDNLLNATTSPTHLSAGGIFIFNKVGKPLVASKHVTNPLKISLDFC